MDFSVNLSGKTSKRDLMMPGYAGAVAVAVAAGEVDSGADIGTRIVVGDSAGVAGIAVVGDISVTAENGMATVWMRFENESGSGVASAVVGEISSEVVVAEDEVVVVAAVVEQIYSEVHMLLCSP